MKVDKEIIIALTKEPIKNRQILDALKRQFAKKRAIRTLPNSQLLKAYHSLVKDERIVADPKIKEVKPVLPFAQSYEMTLYCQIFQ